MNKRIKKKQLKQLQEKARRLVAERFPEGLSAHIKDTSHISAAQVSEIKAVFRDIGVKVKD